MERSSRNRQMKEDICGKVSFLGCTGAPMRSNTTGLGFPIGFRFFAHSSSSDFEKSRSCPLHFSISRRMPPEHRGSTRCRSGCTSPSSRSPRRRASASPHGPRRAEFSRAMGLHGWGDDDREDVGAAAPPPHLRRAPVPVQGLPLPPRRSPHRGSQSGLVVSRLT